MMSKNGIYSNYWIHEIQEVRKRTSLFMGGGGFKILPFLGALHTIGWSHFESISGLSAGALLATALCLDYSLEDLFEICDDFENVIKQSFTLDRVVRMKFGEATGDIAYFLRKLLATSNVDVNVTFKDFRNCTVADINVLSFCIDTCKLVEFSADKTPDVLLVDALLASIALPFIFPPVKINSRSYCDAGIVNSAPLGLFESEDTLALIVRLEADNDISTIPQTLRWRCQFYLLSSLRTAMRRSMTVIQIAPEPGVQILSRMNTPFCVFFARGILCTLLYVIRKEIAGLLAVLHFFPYSSGQNLSTGQRN